MLISSSFSPHAQPTPDEMICNGSRGQIASKEECQIAFIRGEPPWAAKDRPGDEKAPDQDSSLDLDRGTPPVTDTGPGALRHCAIDVTST